MSTVIFEPTPKQQEFIRAVLSGDYRYLLFGGGVGGGKTIVSLSILFAFCARWPGSRWALVRKDLPTLRRNTIPSFNRFRPTNFVSDINQSTWTARCTNGSEIVFFPESFEQDPELDRWKGLEVNGFFLEEMNELHEESFYKAMERAGRWPVTPRFFGETFLKEYETPPPMIIGTCNPSKNYVKRMFYDPWANGSLAKPYFFLQSLAYDNPHLSKEYIENLERLPESQYRVFVKGDWSVADEPDQLIKGEWVEAAFAREPCRTGLLRLGVDPARYGNDDSAIAEMDGGHLESLEAFHGVDTVRLAALTFARMATHNIAAHNVRVDTVGLGAGVADQLYASKQRITEFVAGAKPVNEHKFLRFKDLRSEAWWNYREALREGRASINPSMKNDQKLISDLTAPRYSVDSDRVISVEPKDEIKKRLGRSTDRGDAVVMAYAKMAGASAYLNMINAR